jgi:hypothetical protein
MKVWRERSGNASTLRHPSAYIAGASDACARTARRSADKSAARGVIAPVTTRAPDV